MDAGKLNSRILFYNANQVSDGFGGFTVGFTSSGSVWGHYKQIDGSIDDENGLRQRAITAEVICRKKSVENISIEDVFRIVSSSGSNYRITNIYDSKYKYFVKIEGVLVDQSI